MRPLIQLVGFVKYKGGEFSLPGKGLFLIPYEEVACLARRVPEEEFGEGVLQEHLKDLEWFKRELVEQEEILERVMKISTVIPLKWGTFFRTEEAVIEILKAQYEAVRELLGKLKGREEWTVRATMDRGKLEAFIIQNDPEIRQLQSTTEKLSPGIAYLLTERLKLLKEKALKRAIDEITQEIYAQVMPHAEASATAEPVHGTDDLQRKELVFQMVFLIPNEKHSGFSHAVLKEASRWQPQGFEIHQVGPFPPYYFCHLDIKEAETHV